MNADTKGSMKQQKIGICFLKEKVLMKGKGFDISRWAQVKGNRSIIKTRQTESRNKFIPMCP